MSEMMVLSGNLNVAIDRPVRASATYNLTARWSLNNLVDGRTPFGPPIKRELKAEDGLYSGASTKTTGPPTLPWMQLDLGQVYPLQHVRLHPVHARIGADNPGFSFPSAFKVETSVAPDFAEPVTLFAATSFPNPGNNPVTLRTTNAPARIIRITALETNALGEWRFGLSEVEVYSGGRNVARNNAVVSAISLIFTSP